MHSSRTKSTALPQTGRLFLLNPGCWGSVSVFVSRAVLTVSCVGEYEKASSVWLLTNSAAAQVVAYTCDYRECCAVW